MKKSVIRFVIFPVFFLINCAAMLQTDSDTQGGGTAGSQQDKHIVKGMELSTHIEQQLVNEFRNTSLAKVPEGHFFELQDRLLHSIATFYSPSAEIRFMSERRTPSPNTNDFDTQRIDPSFYFDIFKSINLQICTLSVNEPTVLHATLRKNTPILIFGELYYDRFSTSGIDDKRLFRRHEAFDVLIGYSKLSGPKSSLPGEDKNQYLYLTRTGLSFTSHEGTEFLKRAHNIYGVPNNSRWILSQAYIILPDSTDLKLYAADLARESGFKEISLSKLN